MLASVRHYRLVRPLGAGGMGEVFLAQDTRLDRLVALKFLPAQSAANADLRSRFLSEAKAVAALNHPNICTIHDVGEAEDGRPFIAMELLEGETLAARLQAGSPEMPELIRIGLQIAEALAAAHAKGIVHRDIKPSNLHLTADGRVKVLDFGLAKRLEEEGAEAGAMTTAQTRSGQILGTPQYMSPEQALGKKVDARTDLFALGTVLYEMVTGRAPFAGGNWSETLQKILRGAPEPLGRYNYSVPAELERMVLKCLRKAPEERYQSAQELMIDLRSLGESLWTSAAQGSAAVAPAASGTGAVAALLFLSTNGEELERELGVRERAQLLEAHRIGLERRLKESTPGVVLESVGNTALLSFARPSSAVQFAIETQSATPKPLACRIGIHLGEAVNAQAADPHQRFGEALLVSERLLQLARPGQVLMSRAVFDGARQVVRAEAAEGLGPLSWLNHGPYVLEGVEGTVEICETAAVGRGAGAPPANSTRAQRRVTTGEEQVLGWRPALGQLVPNTPWVLEQKLGEGGFGEAWLGRHQTMKERRVFKFCFRADRVRSLKREMTLFRLLKEKIGEHPRIVALRDVYFDEPPFYVVMEYVEGRDLKLWSEAQGGVSAIPLEARLEIVAQVADALQAAHGAGVIHRDVKPGNILVSGAAAPESGEEAALSKVGVKLTDFGIGQVVSEEALRGMTRAGFTQTMISDTSSSHTGSQLYMAPELLAGTPASPQSDIYSLGVVLYQLIVGDFARPLTTDWVKRISDPLLREDLTKCFAGDPHERFAEAGLLAANLRSLDPRRTAAAQRERAAARGKLLRRAAAALALLATVGFLSLYAFKKGGGGAEAPPTKIAVLPLVNLSGDAAQEYFADELTDDLIAKLGQIGRLRVIVRSTVMHYKKTASPLPEIARELDVDAVLQGTLQRAQDHVRMDIKLFQGSSDRLLWSTQFDRGLRDLFAMENEIALAIASHLGAKLKPEEEARLTNAPAIDPEALDLYYRGKSVGHGAANNLEAIRLLESAVGISKDFAPAWAALANAYTTRFYDYDPMEHVRWEGKAQAAVLEALRVNPNQGEAYVALGGILWSPGRNFQHEDALKLFYRALQLNPSSARALGHMCSVYAHTGFVNEARVKAKEAAALDPLGISMNLRMACTHLWKGEYEQSLLFWPKVDPGLMPAFCGSHWAWALFAVGRKSEANAKIQECLEKHPDDGPGEIAAMKALLLADAGDGAGSVAQLRIAEEKTARSFGETHHVTYLIACAYARLSRTPEALRWLQQSADTGFPCYPLFRDDPNLKSLRADAGFIAFLKRQEGDWKQRKEAWGKLEKSRN